MTPLSKRDTSDGRYPGPPVNPGPRQGSGFEMCAAEAADRCVRVNNVTRPERVVVVHGPLTERQASISAALLGEDRWHAEYHWPADSGIDWEGMRRAYRHHVLAGKP